MTAEQLVLELGMPWDGVSPRYLTKYFEVFSFGRSGASRSIQDAPAVVQLELFPEGTPYGS